ncbi:hypothetical protein [Paenibacillus xerothermodurans]|uniref:Uncharacterized protein n=1 Tax=Paenibacillus xerothermodurans TaxID=1977292 RepID=A0A2W1NTM3_PAEXE|nr:hypothetical protein [Paenibacillus xerothermodurans]PZE22885.1 hypothetical protein CBW46_001960 [Paenibacillus xerothermodurans]
MQSSLQKSAPAHLNCAQRKWDQLGDPAHVLCREDVVWILEFIKKKVAEEDPQLMELSQPRLLQNFRHFAEIALMLINQRSRFDSEADLLKAWIAEATHGLTPSDRRDSAKLSSPSN